MKKAIIRFFCTAAVMAPLAVQAEELIEEFKGSRSSNTLEFEVRDPWIVDWRISGDANEMTAVDVALFNAGTGAHEGVVVRRKMPSNGVVMFNQSGRFYFRVDATLMNWTLKVIQLTKEEAEAYTPKTNHILDR